MGECRTKKEGRGKERERSGRESERIERERESNKDSQKTFLPLNYKIR